MTPIRKKDVVKIPQFRDVSHEQQISNKCFQKILSKLLNEIKHLFNHEIRTKGGVGRTVPLESELVSSLSSFWPVF